MPSVIDPETMPADDLPGLWSPAESRLPHDDLRKDLTEEARARLLWMVSPPETILRLLLNETEIDSGFIPSGIDPHGSGGENEPGEDEFTFYFAREFELIKTERSRDRLYVEYKVQDLGYWYLNIESEKATIGRL